MIFHRAGYIHNYDLYRREYQTIPGIQDCMLAKDSPDYQRHLEGKEMCASLHWQCVEKGAPIDGRTVKRIIGEAQYTALGPITGNLPKHDTALIAWLPIDEIDIVDSNEFEDKSPVMEALEFLSSQTALPIFVTDN